MFIVFAVLVSGIGMKNSISAQDAKQWQEEPNGWLSFPHYMQDGKVRFTFSLDKMPEKILLLTQKAMEYSLETGAAREISRYDFYHGHFLFLKEKAESERSIQTVDALLFHTQEWVFYSNDTYLKRNIFIGSDGVARVLPCEIMRNGAEEIICTNHTADGFSTVGDMFGIYFVDVDGVPSKKLKKYEHNIILIRGRKVLVGQPKFL